MITPLPGETELRPTWQTLLFLFGVPVLLFALQWIADKVN